MGTGIFILFIIGYVMIIMEHRIRTDKAATALITGVLCWTMYGLQIENPELLNHGLLEHLAEISGILFFLIGAMTIVELIDLYDGFQLIIDRIRTRDKRILLWLITGLSFILSAVLDNLTTAIVMSSMLGKILPDKRDRMLMVGMIVIAANAGGAWSPIGDVTTTMLWIGNQITPAGVIQTVLFPSIVCTLVPLLLLSTKVKGVFVPVTGMENNRYRKDQSLMLFAGLGLLLFVPVFKMLTHMPPFMGMMLAVGILWMLSERLHKRRHRENARQISIFDALERIDMPSVLFFMGILLAVSALQQAGVLNQAAAGLSRITTNENIVVTLIGLLSAVFDNVPLVAAIQGMYSLAQFPSDHFFWHYLAYCSGTGGSLLIIGSAAGVAAMGIEEIRFGWYARHIGWLALLGYLAGALVCVVLFA